ncbi:hypothetical protein [Sporosarcina pasteurii]|uniref:Uncharacterized protein n=1 Tax=Sporosarcina pasteurii TaxID=1474 RepID=A0A380BVL4_SPOPA|nr:hypothetical protein [Sporosarcina pasteurii]MDS9471330.1 hypothetical protein [Sporosarcina pasteurii]QBQ05042.1 hypothetical protein E2C16_04865 [Sporosarcina pasteurii]SUJ07806.1 Uncharacterised protein [Sporosarcina pasteurii]
MKFGKRYSNITVFMAMLHGVIIGIAAIAVVGIIFVGAEGNRTVDKIENEIPASGPAEDKENDTSANKTTGSLALYAKQHGAFTTSVSAATFIAEDPSLSTAAIIQSDGQYFVWSAVGLSEVEIEGILEEGTYKKEFSINPTSCDMVHTTNLWEVLEADDIAKIKQLASKNDDEKAKELARHIDTITAFTNDLKVIRLHLLSKYANTNDCVKISF